ncbi:MAG TPA: competence protein ComK [Candidatus Tetragenococcus pullicola]|nr:competence protein ComK [Candidatus Tetragenococcus pullicola]
MNESTYIPSNTKNIINKDRSLFICLLRSIKTNGLPDKFIEEKFRTTCLYPNPEMDKEIYAILPSKNVPKQTFILYKDCAILVKKSSYSIIDIFINYHLACKRNAYYKAMSTLIQKSRNLPLACREYSLINFGGWNKSQALWINPAQISDIHSVTTTRTKLVFNNQLELSLDMKLNTLLSRMKTGFIAYGIIKRDYGSSQNQLTTSLTDFLNISSTDITNRLLAEIEYQDIPGKRNDFLSNL